MKRVNWCLALLLTGTLLFASGCSNTLQEQVDALEEQVDTLQEEVDTLSQHYAPPVIPIEVYEYSDICILLEQFQTQPHIDVVMGTTLGGHLTVILGSNPTTGYQWAEDAEISDGTIVQQLHHVFISPPTDLPGTPGEEIWVFKALERGTTTIHLEYNRWDGAGLWTVTITATIE